MNPTHHPAAIFRVPTEELGDHATAGGKIVPIRILFEEFARARSSLVTLGIGFTVSHAELQWKGDRSKRPPYLCCCYNRGDLGNANIIAFSHPLLNDWELMEKDVQRYSITSMERLKETDRKLHGRDGYLAIELIRQLVQIRREELTSEEARGNAWDKHRRFYVGNFGTTENLLKSIAETLRQAVPKLVTLSPTLAAALAEIEGTIQTIDETRLSQCS